MSVPQIVGPEPVPQPASPYAAEYGRPMRDTMLYPPAVGHVQVQQSRNTSMRSPGERTPARPPPETEGPTSGPTVQPRPCAPDRAAPTVQPRPSGPDRLLGGEQHALVLQQPDLGRDPFTPGVPDDAPSR